MKKNHYTYSFFNLLKTLILWKISVTSHLSANSFRLQTVPALSEITQRRDRAWTLRARRKPAHEAMVQTFYLDFLLVKFPFKLLRETAHVYVLGRTNLSRHLRFCYKTYNLHVLCCILLLPYVSELTFRSHSCPLTDSRSFSITNSSVVRSSADFSHSKRPYEQHTIVYKIDYRSLLYIYP